VGKPSTGLFHLIAFLHIMWLGSGAFSPAMFLDMESHGFARIGKKPFHRPNESGPT
jgi:hypothetical protein